MVGDLRRVSQPRAQTASAVERASSFLALERCIAVVGLLVGIAMVLMKIVPLVPGHFTVYEWLALGIWIVVGAACGRSASAGSFELM